MATSSYTLVVLVTMGCGLLVYGFPAEEHIQRLGGAPSLTAPPSGLGNPGGPLNGPAAAPQETLKAESSYGYGYGYPYSYSYYYPRNYYSYGYGYGYPYYSYYSPYYSPYWYR